MVQGARQREHSRPLSSGGRGQGASMQHSLVDEVRQEDEDPVLDHAGDVHGEGRGLANEQENRHVEACKQEGERQGAKECAAGAPQPPMHDWAVAGCRRQAKRTQHHTASLPVGSSSGASHCCAAHTEGCAGIGEEDERVDFYVGVVHDFRQLQEDLGEEKSAAGRRGMQGGAAAARTQAAQQAAGAHGLTQRSAVAACRQGNAAQQLDCPARQPPQQLTKGMHRKAKQQGAMR